MSDATDAEPENTPSIWLNFYYAELEARGATLVDNHPDPGPIPHERRRYELGSWVFALREMTFHSLCLVARFRRDLIPSLPEGVSMPRPVDCHPIVKPHIAREQIRSWIEQMLKDNPADPTA